MKCHRKGCSAPAWRDIGLPQDDRSLVWTAPQQDAFCSVLCEQIHKDSLIGALTIQLYRSVKQRYSFLAPFCKENPLVDGMPLVLLGEWFTSGNIQCICDPSHLFSRQVVSKGKICLATEGCHCQVGVNELVGFAVEKSGQWFKTGQIEVATTI